MLAVKPDNLSSIPRTHVVEGENQQPQCPLPSTRVSQHFTYKHFIHTHTQFLKCTMIKIMKTFVNKCISLVSKLVLVNFPYDNVKYTLN